MPVYEYQCEECRSEVELLVRGQEVPECPQCASKKLTRLMSAPAGHVAGASRSLPITGSCPPPDAPLCGPGCCRIPQ